MTMKIADLSVLLLAVVVVAGCDPVTVANDASGNRDAPVTVDADVPECTGNAECNDQIACTDDVCSGGTCDNSPNNGLCAANEVCSTSNGCVLPADACNANERCVPAPPQDWNGPGLQMAASGTSTAPSCPAALSNVLVDGHVNLNAEAATCQCTCTPANANCTDTSAADYGDTQCNSALGGGSLKPTCSSLGGGAPAYKIFVPQVDTGTCQKVENPTIPAVERADNRVLCQPDQAVSDCTDGGSCLGRLGSGDTYCVSHSGDVPCPAGTPYQDREVIFTDVDDTRSCSSCTCEGPEGTCTATAQLFNGACDATPDRTVAADGNCQVESSYDNGRLVISSVNASCPATPGAPQGAATEAGLVTMCCTTF